MSRRGVLLDCQGTARFNPESAAPSAAELEAIRPGGFVKVHAEAERFWVRVTEAEGERLAGVVENDLFSTAAHGYRRGSRLTFERRHVWDHMTAEEAAQAEAAYNAGRG